MAVEYYLGIVDYVIVILTLLISTSIGVKFKSSSEETGKMREYFMAGKNMSLLPVIMSAAATMISSLSTIGIPAETYKYGIQFWTMGIGMSIGMVLATYIFIPVYFQCGVCTVYEYLELRFGSPVRYFVSVMFIIEMVLWMSVVLYSPVIAMNVVTHLPIEPTIIAFGAICSIYCAIDEWDKLGDEWDMMKTEREKHFILLKGGLKAVLWTDVFQISFMFVTLIMLYAAGIEDAGGLENIIDHAKEGNRLNFFKFQVDFVSRYTFWNGLFQGVLTGAAIYGVSQTGVQRFLSLKNVERAKSAALFSNPILTVLALSACLHGIILYAVYFMCDPILNNKETGLTNYDQLVPYFLVSVFHSTPGLTGLSVAGIFSGSLTTISSILNSLATVTVVDFVHPIFQSLQRNERKSLLLAKGLSLVYGVICICIALSLTKIKSLTQVGMLFQNTFEGPILAVFTIGVLTRKGFGKSVLFGLLPGFFLTQWIGFSSLFSGYHEPLLPLYTTMCETTFNLTDDYSASDVSNIISPSSTPVPSSHEEIFALSKLPFFWVRTIGFVVTFCCAYITIFISDRNRAVIPPDSKYLSPVVKLWTKNAGNTEHQKKNINNFALECLPFSENN